MAEEILQDLPASDRGMQEPDAKLTNELSTAIPLKNVELGLSTHHETVTVRDGVECRLGNTALSSYCCIVLIIFAFLFILIGSVLIYATTRYSDVEVVQFLNKHKYLKYASPLMFSLGLLMLISGGIFWLVRHCSRTKLERHSESIPVSTTTYCCSDTTGPQLSSRNSLAVLRSRKTSVASAASSRAVSPLLGPSSASAAEHSEWKWPSAQITTAPPLGSFPQLSTDSPSLSSDPGFSMKERCLVHQSCSSISYSSNHISEVVQIGCEVSSPVDYSSM